MPEQIRCPSCDATLRVPDTLLGKNVKCPKCQKAFLAELDAPVEPEERLEEPPPSKARRRPSLPEDEEGIVDEPTPKSRRPAPPDEDEEEPPPEDEDEDRPRRRKRRRRRSSLEAESAVAGPAIALMVVGGLELFFVALGVVLRLLGIGVLAAGGPGGRGGANNTEMMANMAGGIIGSIVGLVLAVLILMGAVKMKKLENYGLAMTSCILAMLPCSLCCILGLPFGIWGLVVINKPEVKDAFS